MGVECLRGYEDYSRDEGWWLFEGGEVEVGLLLLGGASAGEGGLTKLRNSRRVAGLNVANVGWYVNCVVEVQMGGWIRGKNSSKQRLRVAWSGIEAQTIS